MEKARISGSLGRCILPLLDALGWKGGKRTFLNALPYDYRDFSVHDMMNTMANLGFKVNSSKGSLTQLDTRLLPCLFMDGNNDAHVLINYDGKEFLSFDGGSSSFSTLSVGQKTGKFYFFEELALMATSPDKQQQGWFGTFVTRFRKQIAISLVLSFILTCTALMSPLIVMGIYKKINTAESVTGFWIVGVGIVGILVIDLLFRLFRQRTLLHLGARMGYLVSTQVFKRILSFTPAVVENASVGSQIVRMRDFSSVRSFIEGPGIISLMELPFFIILFIGLILIAGNLAYIPAVAGVLLLLFSVAISPLVKKNNAVSATSGSKKQEFLLEFFTEFKAIRMSGLSEKWRNRFQEISATAATDGLQVANINTVINSVAQGVVQIAGTLTIGLGVIGVLNGSFSGAVLIAAMMLVWKILSPLTTGFSVLSQSIRIKKSLLQLNRLMAMPLETLEGDINVVPFRGNILCKGVSFRYKPENFPALLGLELSIQENEFIVINGHEGGGKTTFLKLLMGMYKAQAGGITIDGTNIQQLSPSVLRRSITYVPQEHTLFSATIRENMKYYSPTSSDKAINATLRAMGLLEEINEMPDKLDTQLAVLKLRADYPSFKVRLCLARSLLNQSRVILLDEPAMGLEEKYLQMWLRVLRRLKSRRTIIIASNHPAFKELADKIVTLDMGTIANIEQPEKQEDPAGKTGKN